MLNKTLLLFFCLACALVAQPPTIAGTNPDTAVASNFAFPILVYGTNFQAGARLFWNNTQLITHVNGPLSLTADMPSPLATSAGTAQITVRNPDGTTSNAFPFTIRTTPATPNFVGATTDVEVHFGQATIWRLQVVGSGMQPGLVLSWNGQLFPAEASYPFLGFQIPKTLMMTPGPVDLTVKNPGGSASNVVRLTIPGVRTLSSISPSTIASGTADVTLTANGTGFEPGDFVYVDTAGAGLPPQPQFIDSTRLQVTLPSALIPPPGTYAAFVAYFGAQAGAGVPVLGPEVFPTAVYVTDNILPLTVGPPGCTYSLSSSGATVGAAASSGTVQVITQPGCTWTASSPSAAVVITSGASSTGAGAVNYNVQASTSARSITLTIAGLPYTINQIPACLFGLTPSTATAPAAGATGSFAIGVTQSSCTWTAISNAPWLQILSGAAGTGNGTVNYSASSNAANVGRTGTVTAGGQTFTVVQAGNAPCTFSLAQAFQSFAAAGGTGTATVQAPAGCSWSAVSDVPWLTITGAAGGSGNGTVNYSVAANPSTLTRAGSLTIAGLIHAVTQAGTASSLTCSASTPTAARVALEGRTETVGDVQLSCTGLSGTVIADISLALNTNVTNTLTGGSTTDAVLLVNEANPRNGQLFSYGAIRWTAVPLVADSSGTATVRIAKVRVDASLLTAPANLQTAAVTGLLSVESQTPVPVKDALQTLASALPTLAFSPPQIFDAGSLTRVTVAYSEATATTFHTASGTLPATRLRLVLKNLPANAVVYAPVFPAEGASQAQLYSADASGAGGAPVAGAPFNGGTYQQVAVNNGLATATWVVLAANANQLETRTFVLFLQGVTAAQATAAGISGSLAPVSSVGVASATAPVPRFRDFSTPQRVVNLRVSTAVTRPPGALLRPAVANVGSNITFTTQVVNDDSTQTATNVTLRGNVPSGLTLVSCVASSGQNCATTGGLATVTEGSLPPSGTVTVTTVVAPNALPPGATIVTYDAGVTSDDPNASLSGTSAGSGTILLNGTPVVVGSLPPSGAGTSQAFTFQFSSPLGYQTLGVVNVLINKVLDGRNACYLAYSVPGATLYLVNDAGDAGGPYAGTVPLGGAGTIENSQCSVGLISALGDGPLLTLKLNITFKPGFGGNRIAYVAARDQGTANSDWQAVGVWQVPFLVPGPIATGELTPGRGAGSAGTSQPFKITVTDSKGTGDIGIVNVLINNFIDGRKACYLAYSAPSNTLFLVNDTGDAGGPFAGSMPLNGGNAAIQNSQCAVNAAGSSVAFSANQLTLTLNISFTAAFAGNRVFYIAGRDRADGNSTDWQALGTFTVQ